MSEASARGASLLRAYSSRWRPTSSAAGIAKVVDVTLRCAGIATVVDVTLRWFLRNPLFTFV